MEIIRKYFWLGLGVSLALGAIFSLLGVYDSESVPLFKRFIFWTATMITGSVASALSGPWIINQALKDRHPVFHVLAIAAIISLPITIIVMLFTRGGSLAQPLISWAMQYYFVVLVSVVTTSGTYFVLWSQGRIGNANAKLPILGLEPTDGASDPTEKFLSRLPVAYRGAALYAVSSEDHYCRIHTSKGEELILLRLADAVRELDGADGLQTHRSWWVAKDGVADTRRDNGKLFLTLKSGGEAPVSRAYVGAVKDAGLV